MEKWYIRNKKGNIEKISNEFKISKILAKLLINRDITDNDNIYKFLYPKIESQYDGELMNDFSTAINLIKSKISQRKKIRIIGDYDVDGITSVYILYDCLKKIGADIDYYIPHRINDGYGINKTIVLEAKAQGIDTIITCDNGISQLEPLEIAKNMGMTYIITDHHDIAIDNNNIDNPIFKLADAVINPHKYSCKYPNKNICGAGIAYKIARNLQKTYSIANYNTNYLEFVALATVCDVVDLRDENRIFVVEGLNKIKTTENVGLKTLLRKTGLMDKNITTYHIGFIIGPILNASGRLESALLALELFVTNEIDRIDEISDKLIVLNQERKDMTEIGVNSVIKIIEENFLNDNVLVVYEPTIHESIAGIIAGRVKEKYNKPTIVLTKSKNNIKGSARSIDEYHMYNELYKCKEILLNFGGHPMAAGLSLEKSNIDNLRHKLNNLSKLTKENIANKIYIDMPLPLSSVDEKLIQEINILNPFGTGNPKPLFGAKNINILKLNVLGKNDNVLKFVVEHKGKIYNNIILFQSLNEFSNSLKLFYGDNNLEELLLGKENSSKIDIIYYPELNVYNGITQVQFIIKNYRFI
ncbi:single-stranded-DNA-specific exonuclease RecJ [Soehngenia longivitae]|uniref:Single-stranded-DNA-specific exonuclease RecJ n=1 Tax=Soehngenia longivitae TaxID=2562294 RepID=A0A4Z0D1B7_9FIRM|nr:single-stranded-DNA-specific exonuclease RecJ [Soehngenia longivitae]TFZ39541.1 single-stranded-DNA-specific exonuclease RecJ [Soehngenia longivitae]